MKFEANTVSQCDVLIEALQKRKAQLVKDVASERDRKHTVLREQVQHCTGRLQKTTGLLQFSIEVLKETDPAAFVQVSGGSQYLMVQTSFLTILVTLSYMNNLLVAIN